MFVIIIVQCVFLSFLKQCSEHCNFRKIVDELWEVTVFAGAVVTGKTFIRLPCMLCVLRELLLFDSIVTSHHCYSGMFVQSSDTQFGIQHNRGRNSCHSR